MSLAEWRALIGGSEHTYFFNGSTLTVQEDMPVMQKGVYAYERVFFVTAQYPQRLYFSKAGDCTVFDENDGGGYIDLDEGQGTLYDFACCGEKLILLRKGCVSTLVHKGIGTDFMLTTYSAAMPVPLANSVCAYQGEVVFATAYGLFATDGKEVRMLDVYFHFTPTAAVCSGTFEGYYFVTLTAGNVTKTYFYDGEKGVETNYSFTCAHSYNKKCGVVIGGNLYFLSQTQFTLPCDSMLTTIPVSFFDSVCNQVIDGVTLFGEGNLAVDICSDRGERTIYMVDGSAKVQKLGLRGREFTLTVTADSAATLKRISLAILKTEGKS